MQSTTVASGTFPSRTAADRAVRRLVAGGFARNSIELRRHADDEGYDLEVHTREDNLERVEELIHASAPMHAIGQAASDMAQTARSHPVMLLGAGILAGFLIYNLLPRGRGMSMRPRQSAARSSRGR